MLIKVAAAILELHRVGIVHGDLKWGNILLDENNNPKLADFGFSVALKGQPYHQRNNYLGSAHYSAPEVITFFKYSFASDIFAFGSMMFVISERKIPLSRSGSDNLNQACQAIAAGVRERIGPDCPPGLATLITKCWLQHPNERPSAEYVYTELERLAAMQP